MKYFFAILIANSIGFAAQANDQSPPQIVPTSYSQIYIPKGFDTNDNVQIAAEGLFPNTCFKIAPASYSVDEKKFQITLDAKAYQYKGMCMQILIPYQQVVDLGIVRTAGTYKVQTSSGKVLGEIEVGRAKVTEADDYLYAPVQRVTFEDGPNNRVSLRIEFNHSCLKLSEVKVDKHNNVVVLQPIAHLTPDFGCAIGYYPVVENVDVGFLNRGHYLLHVRSSGSQAFNQIIAVE